ncbi:penicillin-binding protein 1A [Streptococcus pneumoniae]|nr:penicillin-binding protein 1A [Streptococcus pneumoniae]
MAAAYAAFANGGTYYKPMYIHKVVFSDGIMELDEMPILLGSLRLVKQEPLTIQTRKLKTTSRPLNL